MPLGAYSIIRYSDDVNDQRINLGVVAWHPTEGTECAITEDVSRVQAIDPGVRLTPIRRQLEYIEEQLEGVRNKDTLLELASCFKEGLEVTEPYPARMHSLQDSLAHLFRTLVAPAPGFRRRSSQRMFEGAFRKTLQTAIAAVAEKASLEEIGECSVNGVTVPGGIQTTARRRKILWRALSLHSARGREDQLARAKATALDVRTIRSIDRFKRIQQIVVLEPSKPQLRDQMDESIAWLAHERAEVIQVPDRSLFEDLVTARLSHGPS